jgi:hypothetical protein
MVDLVKNTGLAGDEKLIPMDLILMATFYQVTKNSSSFGPQIKKHIR